MAYNIGDVGPAGGTIFFVPIPGVNDFYYEIAPVDIGTATYPQNTSISPNYIQPCSLNREPGFEFGSKGVSLGTSMGLGDGKNNTDLICAAPSGGSTSPPNPVFDINKIAAQACKSWVYGGANDWFLPSMTEMLVANQYVACNWTSRGTGIYKYYTDEYWTSSEYGAGAFAANFLHPFGGTTYTGVIEKCHTRSVRAIRRFKPGIEYNFRYEAYTIAGQSSDSPDTGQGGVYKLLNWNSFPTGWPSFGTNGGPVTPMSIGGQYFAININKIDTNLVSVDSYFPAVGHIFTFEVYDWEENLLGTWDYQQMSLAACGAVWCTKAYLFIKISGSAYINLNKEEGPFYFKISCPNLPSSYVYSDSSELLNYAGTGKNLRNVTASGNPNTAIFAGYNESGLPAGINSRYSFPFSWHCKFCSGGPNSGHPRPWYPNVAPTSGSGAAATFVNNPNNASTYSSLINIAYWVPTINTPCTRSGGTSAKMAPPIIEFDETKHKWIEVGKGTGGVKQSKTRKSFKRKK